ncbi:MAG: response regulator [Ruminococcaceae bacterium]|nr:response regulator [Oscillospiraceae bacterium]
MFQILVVDDDKNTRMLLRAVLQAENYTVFTAENGEDALTVMDQEHIDLVVLDVMMPKMDGYAFTKLLRERLQQFRQMCRQKDGSASGGTMPALPNGCSARLPAAIPRISGSLPSRWCMSAVT